MGILDKVKGLGAGFIVGKVLKSIAEGKYGTALQWLYLHLNGLITVIGVVFGVVAGFIGVLDHYGVCALAVAHWAWFDCGVLTAAITKGTAGLSAFCIWIGQINGSVHLDPPDPAKLAEAVASFKK